MNKIVIDGEYWDSYIYSNNLILFGYDGTIKSYIWDSLLKSKLEENSPYFLGYKCAFLQGDYLYGISEKDLFDDIEIKCVIENKFKHINDLYFTAKDMEKYENGRTDELSQLPIDIVVYKNTLYYCNSDGFYKRNLRRNNNIKYISSREQKIWDGKVQYIKLGHGGRIALSASSDGLFEFDDKDYNVMTGEQKFDDIIQISDKHSSYCSWSFSSLFSGSYSDESFLYGFSYQNNGNNHYLLEHHRSYEMKQLFSNSNGLYITNNEKIYCLDNNQIRVIQYTQKNLGTEYSPFLEIKNNNTININEEIISAEVMEFGIVIETMHNLFVILSTGEMINVNGKEDFVSWRVFPKSISYINQLHIIYNNRIEILSFNEDYFVKQDDKLFGNKYRNYKQK